MLIKQFYRSNRGYWYKLILSKGIFYIIYDYRECEIGKRVYIRKFNKTYSYTNIDDALKTFNSWMLEYFENNK